MHGHGKNHLPDTFLTRYTVLFKRCLSYIILIFDVSIRPFSNWGGALSVKYTTTKHVFTAYLARWLTEIADMQIFGSLDIQKKVPKKFRGARDFYHDAQ